MLSSASHLSWRSFDALQFSVWSGRAYYSSFHSYTNRNCFLRPIHHNWHSVFVSKWTKMSYHPCIVLTVFLWLFHWELTIMWNPCETLSEMYVKIKSEKVDFTPFSHLFHNTKFHINVKYACEMPVKSMWKTCENRPFYHLVFAWLSHIYSWQWFYINIFSQLFKPSLGYV